MISIDDIRGTSSCHSTNAYLFKMSGYPQTTISNLSTVLHEHHYYNLHNATPLQSGEADRSDLQSKGLVGLADVIGGDV
jgi:hypothetical protein